MSSLLWYLLFGLVAGVIAKLVLPGPNPPHGIIGTVLVGIAGSFVGSFLGQFFGFYKAGELAGLVGSIAGAIVVLVIYGWLFKKKPTA
ncbi:MAG: GlsB/YeaQ/YmgE family stress response membrane protein [Hyphomicrobiales bacterium]